MAIRKRYTKDPNAILDYTILWVSEDGTNDGSETDTGFLQGDTIAASTWEADEGISLESSSSTSTYASVWLSGGEVGKRYTVTNRITTALGRVDDRSFIIVCEQK